MRRLPPLRALRTFEAAARLASVTAAAEELNVSHSAVSQQIKQLEEYFGQKLFKRSGRGIEPTPEAAAYLEDLKACLDRIAIASEQLTQRNRGRVLKVNATPSFAMRWLIPRTAAFQLDNPSIDLRISTSTSDGIEHLNEPVDFIIRRDVMARANHVCRRFLDDVSTVVVSPALFEKQRLRDPHDLLKVPLLHLRSRPDAWRRWFKVSEVNTPDAIAGPFFDHFFLSLQAAINGLGAAIVPHVLIQDDLSSGRLVRPFPDRNIVGPGFHVLYRTAAVKEHAGRIFLDWLLARRDGRSGNSHA
jgi:LysR family transcriptional regulator, glycine cleavage system transcriptional activator